MKFDIVEWMNSNGHPGYKNRILKLKEQIEAVLASNHVSQPDRVVANLYNEIEEVKDEAEDRYRDWASDGLSDQYDWQKL